jgi:hypothetical protein
MDSKNEHKLKTFHAVAAYIHKHTEMSIERKLEERT